MAAAVALHTSPRMRRLTAILVVRNGQLPISKRAHLSPWRLLYGSKLAVILLSEVPKMLYMEHSPIWRTADRIRKAISWTAFNFDSRHLNLRDITHGQGSAHHSPIVSVEAHYMNGLQRRLPTSERTAHRFIRRYLVLGR